MRKSSALAASHAGDILAAAVSLATTDADLVPGPVVASTAGADNRNIVAAGRDSVGAGDVAKDEVVDRETAGGRTVEIATVVVLLDQDTVP